jgi:hypothetical protein
MAEASKNKKGNRTLIIVIGFLVLVFIILVIYNHLKDKPVDDVYIPPADPNPNNNTTPAANDSFPLKKGSKGPNVMYLQKAINRIVTNPALKVAEDGSFGDKTYYSLVSGVGTSTWWSSKPEPIYPVTSSAFTQILQKSNANRVRIGDSIYEFSNN